jgi:hypothetical protein
MTFETILQRMAAVHKAKNADYGSSYNPPAPNPGRPGFF